MKISKTSIILIFLFIFNLGLSSSSFAQEDGGGAGAEGGGDVDQLVEESKNDLLMVVGGGLAGAVLGLSTLSFVDEPKEHTRNILIGASIGIIAGVAFVAINQANKSRNNLYENLDGGGEEEEAYLDPKDFSTFQRYAWHNSEQDLHAPRSILTPMSVGYSFNY